MRVWAGKGLLCGVKLDRHVGCVHDERGGFLKGTTMARKAKETDRDRDRRRLQRTHTNPLDNGSIDRSIVKTSTAVKAWLWVRH